MNGEPEQVQADERMTSALLKYTREAAFFCVLAALAYLLYVHRGAVVHTLSGHMLTTLYAGTLSAIAITVQALNFLHLLDGPAKPALGPTTHMWAMANLANYLGPFQPGLAVRVAFFKRHGISVAATAAATLRQIHLSTWTAMGLAASGLLSDNTVIRGIAAGGVCLFLAWPYLLAFARRNLAAWAKRSETIAAREASLATLLSTVPVRRLGLFIVQYLLMAASFYGVYWAFDAALAPHQAMLLAIVTALSTLVSITPNNLGIQEALLGYVAHLGGLSASESLSVALLYRIAHVGACFALLAITLGLRNPAR